MANFYQQLEEIKILLSSNARPINKPLAYSFLLHLQEQSSNNYDSVHALGQNSHSLLSSIMDDMVDGDEEIAAKAVKCLGFMVYHPSIVPLISVEDANLVMESLTELITTTKMKSVCNLGVWCLSIQQFDASIVAAHFGPVLRAVVHALDNPVGSLSTTFEAIQAVVKLSTQLSGKMREMSDIWAPPIYRRLVSIDKKERDISERSLLKIWPTISPPLQNLSKVLVLDMNKKLLHGLKELLNHGMKVPALRAWGWFIRLLGSYVTKNNHLINKMLKIPEQTFCDFDAQVQIASQVAWEGLIDALIHPPGQLWKTNTEENRNQKMTTFDGDNTICKLSKCTKLIMTPLIGIMSSKCDVSVHLSCLKTWCYLLHKLDTFVNHPSVIKAVLEPILQAVFQIGPDIKNMWMWDFCQDLLEDSILSNCRDMNSQINNDASTRSTSAGKGHFKQYTIKWLPWDLDQLDFYIKLIHILINRGSTGALSPENRRLACDAAIRVFRLVLKRVQVVLKSPSTRYNDIMLSLNTILQFIKRVCECSPEESSCSNSHFVSLQFVDAVTEELELSILTSPSYKVKMDLKYIENSHGVNKIACPEVLATYSISFMDMVQPVVYLTVIFFTVVMQSTSGPFLEHIEPSVNKFLKFLISSSNFMDALHAIVGLLYKHTGSGQLEIWMMVAKVLAEFIVGLKDLSILKKVSDARGYSAICHVLSYPILALSCSQKQLSPLKISGTSEPSIASSSQLEFELVVEVWKSLYGSVSGVLKFEHSSLDMFLSDLCSVLNWSLDQFTSALQCGTERLCFKNQKIYSLSLCGGVVCCIFEELIDSKTTTRESRGILDSDIERSVCIGNCSTFAARFTSVLWTDKRTDQLDASAVTARVFSALAHFVGCLRFKQDILRFVEIMSDPLLQWLSHSKGQDEGNLHPLQLLWTRILNALRKCDPQITFDSAFLKIQAPLLEKTLDHPSPSISEPTITFWNLTYGEQMELDCPSRLLDALDRLSTKGKISLRRRNPFHRKSRSRPEVGIGAQGFRVTATSNRSSKRVELFQNSNLRPPLKRRKHELTEHQKEVKRAQQGKERDCSGHGPGFKTYTSLDFSQENDDSQESQDIRDPEAILEMLRRTR